MFCKCRPVVADQERLKVKTFLSQLKLSMENETCSICGEKHLKPSLLRSYRYEKQAGRSSLTATPARGAIA